MSVQLKELNKNYEEDLSKELEKSCKVSEESLDKKEEILPEISLKDIEKFNDTLSDDGNCDIKKYKEHFLKYFEKNFKEYYEDFEEYFSDSNSDSSSSEDHDREYKEKSKSNIGEKDEIKCIKKLFKLNKLNQNKKLEYIFGKEATEGIELIDPETNKKYNEITKIKKTSSSSKADVFIKMKKTGQVYNSTIKSFTGSNPTILNHTPRKANVFQKGILYKELSNIDTYVNEYIEKINEKK